MRSSDTCPKPTFKVTKNGGNRQSAVSLGQEGSIGHSGTSRLCIALKELGQNGVTEEHEKRVHDLLKGEEKERVYVDVIPDNLL